MGADGSVSSLQDGVFRTNCIDCLDRTNVVQSLIARKSLQDQLQVENNDNMFLMLYLITIIIINCIQLYTACSC